MKLDAIMWDYDGTMVNSVPKNIDVTKEILSIVAPRLTGLNLPQYLKSEAAYHEAIHATNNWQELYTDYYGMTESEMLAAGLLWAKHQDINKTKIVNNFFCNQRYLIVIRYIQGLQHDFRLSVAVVFNSFQFFYISTG